MAFCNTENGEDYYYLQWLKNPDSAPLLSHQLFKKKVFPLIDAGEEPLFFILIDNLRLDQWKTIQPIIMEYFKVVEEDTYCVAVGSMLQ